MSEDQASEKMHKMKFSNSRQTAQRKIVHHLKTSCHENRIPPMTNGMGTVKYNFVSPTTGDGMWDVALADTTFGHLQLNGIVLISSL